MSQRAKDDAKRALKLIIEMSQGKVEDRSKAAGEALYQEFIDSKQGKKLTALIAEKEELESKLSKLRKEIEEKVDPLEDEKTVGYRRGLRYNVNSLLSMKDSLQEHFVTMSKKKICSSIRALESETQLQILTLDAGKDLGGILEALKKRLEDILK